MEELLTLTSLLNTVKPGLGSTPDLPPLLHTWRSQLRVWGAMVGERWEPRPVMYFRDAAVTVQNRAGKIDLKAKDTEAPSSGMMDRLA